ncbi:hypothetical protein LZ495_41970, partial [Yinghuangia sp. KLBMP8922]|nr:hypothetical protein [Yinghuangia soli]
MTRNSRQFEGTEAELAALTREVDEAHRATLPAMYASAAELGEQIRDRQGALPTAGLDRRRFLRGAGLLGLSAFALAACSSDDKSTAKSTPSASSTQAAAAPGGTYTGDLQVVALATALENQAVAAYQAAIQAAGAGKLGTVPPAVASFATTAMAQHA